MSPERFLTSLVRQPAAGQTLLPARLDVLLHQARSLGLVLRGVAGAAFAEFNGPEHVADGLLEGCPWCPA